MKLQKRQKGLNEVRADAALAQDKLRQGYNKRPRRSVTRMEAEARQLVEKMRQDSERREFLSQVDPVAANEAGLGYNGPNMADKGVKDGSCNRTACQLPLAGKPQFWMQDLTTHNGRLYYCAHCARLFDESDRDDMRKGFKKPGDYGLNADGFRCSPDEDNVLLERAA